MSTIPSISSNPPQPPQPPQPPPSENSLGVKFMHSAFAGVVSRSLAASATRPITALGNTVNNGVPLAEALSAFTQNPLDCYKGHGAELANAAAKFGLTFALNDTFVRALSPSPSTDGVPVKTPLVVLVSSAGAGFISTAVTAPLDSLDTQANVGRRGVKLSYVGSGALGLGFRGGLQSMGMFGALHVLESYFYPNADSQHPIPIFSKVLMSAASGGVGAIVAQPAHVYKTYSQLGRPFVWSACFEGVSLRCLRGSTAYMITIPVAQFIKSQIKKGEN